MLDLLALAVGCDHVGGGPELAEVILGGCLPVLEEASPPHDSLPLVGHLLELSLGKIAGAAVVE